jgi:hypothetical protein
MFKRENLGLMNLTADTSQQNISLFHNDLSLADVSPMPKAKEEADLSIF